MSFELKGLPVKDQKSLQWLAYYSSRGKVALFRIELQIPEGSSKEIPVSFGKGRIIAEPASDSSVMLVDLQKALQAKFPPKTPKRVSDLPFTYATLGENQSRLQNGSFTSEPAGKWIAMKIFITADADDAAEVFLNLNPPDGRGEFSIKDPDYGDAILGKLATVL